MLTSVAGFLGRNAILPIYRRRLTRFMATLDAPAAAQAEIGAQILARAEGSAFGRERGLAGRSSHTAIHDALAITTYADIAPYVQRLIDGEADALFPASDRVEALACTTGSTGTPKILPVTRQWLACYRRGWELWGAKAIVDHPDIAGSYWLQLGGPRKVLKTADGRDVGMISAITAEHQSPIVRHFYGPDVEVADIADPELRLYITMRQALMGNISMIVTSTAANLIALAELGDAHKERLIRDIFDGTFAMAQSGNGAGADAMRRWGRKLTRRNRGRARELEAIVSRTGTLLPKDYWHVAMVGCWVGGTVGNQAARLGDYYGDAAVRDIGYLSTKGRHTIPLGDRLSGGVLDTRAAYYEFMPQGTPSDGASQTVGAHQLLVGGSYSVLISTLNGLYRYRLDDIVRCIGHVGATPVLEFLQKSHQYSDMEGEKISAYQVTMAHRSAADETGLHDVDVALLAVRPDVGPPYYAVMSEKLAGLKPEARQQFLASCEQALIESNVMYKLKRQDGSVGTLRALNLRPGSWRRHVEIVGRQRGTYETQYKQMVLYPSGSWPEGVTIAEADINDKAGVEAQVEASRSRAG